MKAQIPYPYKNILPALAETAAPAYDAAALVFHGFPHSGNSSCLANRRNIRRLSRSAWYIIEPVGIIIVSIVMTGPIIIPVAVLELQHFSIRRPIASGQDNTLSSFCLIVDGHLIPSTVRQWTLRQYPTSARWTRDGLSPRTVTGSRLRGLYW